MLKLSSWLAIAFFTFLGATPALALSPVTFVSGEGTNSGTCASPATPCRTFQFALGQTSPGGEIKALDPADYGGVTITNSISITGVEGAGINSTAGSDITINAGPNDAINLSHLILDGGMTASIGIVLNSGGSLTVTNWAVRNFADVGVQLSPTANTTFLIQDTVVSGNNVGVSASSQGAGTDQGTLDNVSVEENGHGIFVGAHANVLAVNSAVNDNATNGFDVFNGGVLRLTHSAVTGNLQGVIVVAGSMAESAGNNVIRGNGTDVDGTLTNVGTQ
jgi:hypothetical protein